jgi:NADH:ubiquinone reductase (H+-translocating)
MELQNKNERWPRVVIIGAGFGGLYAAKQLANHKIQVTVIDRTNHHLFQPLLYQVATAGLSPGDIAQPIRHILKYAGNTRVLMENVEHIDVAKRCVQTQIGTYEYDHLIVAAGARHSYFGNDQWEQYAPGLKNLEDALELRRRILSAFEVAEVATDKAVHDAALTFLVVGGGPTGVEMAGAIAELAKRTLVDDFRHIKPKEAKVILVDAAPRVLPVFAEALSESARRQLMELGVEVRVNTKVLAVNENGIQLDHEFIPARTIIWAAGNAASPLGKKLGVEIDRQGRVVVEPDLTIKNHPEIQVIGDLSNFSHQEGRPLPGVAQTAMQQGTHAAKNVLLQAAGKPTAQFSYNDKGSMATIGRNKAVADVHFAKFSGYPAWLGWLFIHLIFLIGFKNQIQVLFQWAWAYFTYARGARLIYGRFKPAQPAPKPEAS